MGVEDTGPSAASSCLWASFNGATPRWAWKTRGSAAASARTGDGFNGATPRWAWKTMTSTGGENRRRGLQWGHATMGVEDLHHCDQLGDILRASMGPRHDGRGRRDRGAPANAPCRAS